MGSICSLLRFKNTLDLRVMFHQKKKTMIKKVKNTLAVISFPAVFLTVLFVSKTDQAEARCFICRETAKEIGINELGCGQEGCFGVRKTVVTYIFWIKVSENTSDDCVCP